MKGSRHVFRLFKRGTADRWTQAGRSIWERKQEKDPEEEESRVLRTLTDQPPWLEARYLYDARGSRLFEEICSLPEYYLTRVESSLLKSHSREILETAGIDCLVELGAGFSVKTRYLLDSLVRTMGGGHFVPLDVSREALVASRDAIEGEFPDVFFSGLHAGFAEALPELNPRLRKMVVYLGSSVGNFMRLELLGFFRQLAGGMGRGDFLLLGFDRLKDSERLLQAYNDRRGVTAQFVLNALSVLNDRIGTDFDLTAFTYQPCFNRDWRQVEMWVEAQQGVTVRFPHSRLDLRFQAGDKVLIEVSRKFRPEPFILQLKAFGLSTVKHFEDRDSRFSLLLCHRD